MNIVHEIEKVIVSNEKIITGLRMCDANMLTNVILDKLDELGFDIVKREDTEQE